MHVLNIDYIKHLPDSYRIFYELCMDAGIEIIREKDDKNDNEGKPQIFNKKSMIFQKTLFLDDDAQAPTS